MYSLGSRNCQVNSPPSLPLPQISQKSPDFPSCPKKEIFCSPLFWYVFLQVLSFRGVTWPLSSVARSPQHVLSQASSWPALKTKPVLSHHTDRHCRNVSKIFFCHLIKSSVSHIFLACKIRMLQLKDKEEMWKIFVTQCYPSLHLVRQNPM